MTNARPARERHDQAGKKALVTGGNSGTGLATTRLLVAEGAQVAVTGRDRKSLDEEI